jgi:hypothetical protein
MPWTETRPMQRLILSVPAMQVRTPSPLFAVLVSAAKPATNGFSVLTLLTCPLLDRSRTMLPLPDGS